MRKTEYIIRIGSSDRYRHLHTKEGGKIVFFRVQYETKIDDKWFAVEPLAKVPKAKIRDGFGYESYNF